MIIDGGEQIEDCVGSPLVIDLEADGLDLRGPDSGARFALLGGRAMPVGWLAGGDDALLARDLDGDGAVTSGRELFGEGTGGWAPDGFAALAREDANADGVIDAEDPVYASLLAWTDDGDGVSEAGEIQPLARVGVAAVPLQARRLGIADAFGNQLGLEVSARTSGGGAVPVVDVWFRFGR